MVSTGDPLSNFLSTRRSDLRRIAARTCGEHTVEDVSGESWLIAQEISRKRGLPIDFLNADDQELVLSWLHCRLVRFADKSVRFAVKLDKDWDNQDSEAAINALARLLTAPEQFDPLVRMLDEEEKFDPLSLVRHSYSQASAYVILLHRFNWDLDSLAEHLQLVTATVRSKVTVSGVHMRNQPSLFDRICSIDLNFIPTIARRIPRAPEVNPGQVQLGWAFPASRHSRRAVCRRRERRRSGRS